MVAGLHSRTMLSLVQVFALLFTGVVANFDYPLKTHQLPVRGSDYGDPLFLTPYLTAGKLEEGRKASRVSGLMDTVESYSGFFTVNATTESNLFFWYFPAEKKRERAPVVLWLQGGPGTPSLFGLFTEHGPFFIDKNLELKVRQHRWNKMFNLIYIDSPVGTGFSFTGQDSGYARDQIKVGADLYAALLQFFRLFPELQKNEFYAAGESYAGKYVPALAYTIHKANPSAELKINLKGLAMGDGYSAPDLMLQYGEYLYQIGLIDSNGRESFGKTQDRITKLITEENWKEAANELFSLVVFGGLFQNLTTFTNHYNFLYPKDDNPLGDMNAYMTKDTVRKSLHVGNCSFHAGTEVQQHLTLDFPKSVKPWVEELVERYKVLIYSGQLDIIVAYPLQVNFLRNLKWSGAEDYLNASRKPWWVGEALAGYTRTVKQLTEVLVRNAGHMVPTDQPLWAQTMITNFVFNRPF